MPARLLCQNFFDEFMYAGDTCIYEQIHTGVHNYERVCCMHAWAIELSNFSDNSFVHA